MEERVEKPEEGGRWVRTGGFPSRLTLFGRVVLLGLTIALTATPAALSTVVSKALYNL